MTETRILIADDHEVVRHGVRALLESQPGWTVCGEASTGHEAVAMAIALKPHVVVLDISMPELNGLEATRQLRRTGPVKILVLTVHESEQVVAEVIEAGADGYVLKADAGRVLVDAIRALLRHRKFLTNRVHAAASRPGRSLRMPADLLTPREREVLQLLAEAKTNKEVAAALGIAVRTAETHRTRILAKLDLHSVGELVRYAIRHRIIEP